MYASSRLFSVRLTAPVPMNGSIDAVALGTFRSDGVAAVAFGILLLTAIQMSCTTFPNTWSSAAVQLEEARQGWTRLFNCMLWRQWQV